MKSVALLAAIALVPGVFLVQASGSVPVAVMDFDRAVADTPEGKDAIAKLNALTAERRTAIENKVKQAVELENRLRTQGRILNEAARTQLSQELESAQTEIETMQEEAQGRLSKMQAELLGPVEAKMTKAVETYASERGVRIVLDSSVLRSGLVFVHDTADITTEILRRVAADTRKTPGSFALFAPRKEASFRPTLRFAEGKVFDMGSFRAIARAAD